MSQKIGFVGLGTMGFPMAVNLKKAGFEVIGYDAFKDAYGKANAAGITMVETLKEVAEQADEAIISMVRDYAQNVDVIFGEDGLLTAQPTGKTIIVMSTLDPDSMNELGEKVEAESDLKLISAAVNSQVAKLVNNMILGITMNAVAEGLKLGCHYNLPQEEILNL